MFHGAGSMALSVMWRNKNARFWINDANRGTYCFWINLHKCPSKMQKWVSKKKAEHPTKQDTRNLYDWCRANIEAADDFEAGCMWFILNRISFNGHGVFTDASHFTAESVAKLKTCGDLLRSVDLSITNYDYSALLSSSSKNTFIFLDPPYDLGSKYCYGDLHRDFDHDVFSLVVKESRHKWMVTYNDIPEIRQRFHGFKTTPLTMKYKKDGQTAVEIVIKNY